MLIRLHAQKQQSNKCQMSHFHFMHDILQLLVSTYNFQFYNSRFQMFYARCNLKLPTAYVYSPGVAVSSVTVDMIAICCHELRLD